MCSYCINRTAVGAIGPMKADHLISGNIFSARAAAFKMMYLHGKLI